jgi:hypothetical protein
MSIILILADSNKNNGYCIAGKDMTSNRWVRIVSNPMGGALSWNQKALTDQTGVISYEPLWKTLDIQLRKQWVKYLL